MGPTTQTHSDDDSGKESSTPRPLLMLALECRRPLAQPAVFDLSPVSEVLIGRGAERAADTRLVDGRLGMRLAVDDSLMSTEHARLSRRGREWEVVDLGSKNGTFVNGESVERAEVTGGDVLEIGGTVFVFRHEAGAVPTLDEEPAVLRTLRPSVAAHFARLRRVADTPLAVLIQGATGTGKELMARAIHDLSGRGGDFVAVNCGAIPEQLTESALFGNLRGAFSGADREREGFVQAADKGTLFLDEVAELSLTSQTALLRVLQEHEVTPVGATRPTRVDIRVVSATHQDLPRRIEEGLFREDLYARLAGFVVHVPCLRERREDLGLLLGALLQRHDQGDAGRWRIRRAAARALFHYQWPRNVRELETVLRSSMALADGVISADELPAEVREAGQGAIEREPAAAAASASQELEALLEQYQGNVSAVARHLGQSRQHVHRLLRRFDIEPASFRKAGRDEAAD